MWITHTGIEKSSIGAADWLGWEFVVNDINKIGDLLQLASTWEKTFLAILRYPPIYSDQPIKWRCEQTGEIASLISLQPAFDASRYFDHCVETAYAGDGDRRLCFGLYDDGSYRFMLEQEDRENGLSAWEPRQWSERHADLASAKLEAKTRFDWFK